MSTKKFFISLIAGFVTSMILTSIYYYIMDEPNMVDMRRSEMIYPGLMATHLLFVGLMILIYQRWRRVEESAVRQGSIFGVLMAAMMFIPQAVLVRSIWTVDFNGIFIVNIIAHLLIGAVIGIVIALIIERK